MDNYLHYNYLHTLQLRCRLDSWTGFGPSWTLYTVYNQLHKMQICFINVWAEINTVQCTLYISWAVCTQLCSWLPFGQWKFQIKNKKNKNKKMGLTLDPKTFQAKHLCLLCLSKNNRNAVAHSILPVSELDRKQRPLKIKN